MVIDTVGTPVFAATRRSLARGGRWVMVGQLDRRTSCRSTRRSCSCSGISMLSATSVTREELRRCLHLVAGGTVRAMVDAVLPLAEAAEAHRRVEAGLPLGRLVLAPAA